MSDVKEMAKDFKESSAYVLEGYLDMCQADLPRKKRCWLELHMDSCAFTDGKLVHLGLFTLKDVFEFFTARYPDVDEAGFFAYINEYLLGHENQHTRSTRNKDWEAAQKAVEFAVLRELNRLRRDGKVFKNNKDYDAYVEFLKSVGLGINKEVLGVFSHFIVNSIEDGRIERIRAAKRPGFGTIMRLIRSTLYEMRDANEYLDGAEYDAEHIPTEKELDVLLGQLLSLATCSVYEKNFFTTFAGTKTYDTAHRMITPIRNGVNSGCCRGIVKASEEVAEILAPYVLSAIVEKTMEKSMEKAQEKMKQSGSGSEEEKFNTQASEEETDEGGSEKDSDVVNSAAENGEESLHNKPSQKEKPGEEPGKNGEETTKKRKTEAKEGEQETGAGFGGSDESTIFSEKNSGKSEEKSGSSESTNNHSESEASSEEGTNPAGNGSERGEYGEGNVEKDADDFDISGRSIGNKLDPFKERKAESEKAGKEDFDALKEAMKTAASQMDGIAGQISAGKASAKRKIAAVKTTALPVFKPLGVQKVFPNIQFKEVFREYKLDTPMPYDLQVRADKFAKDIEELFKNQETPLLRCVETGKIDPSAIYKLGLNMIDCFEQDQEAPEFSGCAYFLCDNSGSMGRGMGSKRYYANTALSIIEQGFTKHMPIKMTAFDAGHNIIIHEVLKNWDEDLPVSGAYNFAIKGRGGAGNADGYSIRVATEELLARPEEEKMLIVLSDGAPSKVSYSTPIRAEDEVRQAVEDARDAGIRVISIYFEHENYRTPEIFEYMYGKKNSIVCNPEDVEDELASLMQTFVFG